MSVVCNCAVVWLARCLYTKKTADPGPTVMMLQCKVMELPNSAAQRIHATLFHNDTLAPEIVYFGVDLLLQLVYMQTHSGIDLHQCGNAKMHEYISTVTHTQQV